MSVDLKWFSQYLAPAAVLLVSIIIGLILQYLVGHYVVKAAQKSRWRGDDIIIRGLKGKIVIWAMIVGLYSALPMINLSPQYSDLAQKILLVLVIASITLVISSILGGFIHTYTSDEKGTILSTTIFSIFTRVVILTIGVLIILQALNISITPMLTALGVGGLAVALALQDTLSNLFAGFHIILTRKVRINDWVELASGETGQVIDITWRDTTIKQRRNNIIIVPNSTLASTITTNFSLPKRELSVRVEVGVSYDSDLEQVEKVTIEVAEDIMKNVKGAVASHKPFIRYYAFGDSSINFYVNLRMTSYESQFRIIHEFIKRLHKRYNEEGIVIPFPIRTLDIPKGFSISANQDEF
jgi:small-conductance mechanosensitive channel